MLGGITSLGPFFWGGKGGTSQSGSLDISYVCMYVCMHTHALCGTMGGVTQPEYVMCVMCDVMYLARYLTPDRRAVTMTDDGWRMTGDG